MFFKRLQSLNEYILLCLCTWIWNYVVSFTIYKKYYIVSTYRHVFSSNHIVHKISFSLCFEIQALYLIDFSKIHWWVWSPKTKAKWKLMNNFLWQKSMSRVYFSIVGLLGFLSLRPFSQVSFYPTQLLRVFFPLESSTIPILLIE